MIYVLNLGDSKLNLSDFLKVSEEVWRPKYGKLFEQDIFTPGNTVYIKLPSASIIVDPNDYSESCQPGSKYFPSPGYQPPPTMLEQLDDLSVKPSDITKVIITHAHYDHYAGVTIKNKAGVYEPTFPNARYYLGAADWEASELVGDALNKEGTPQRRTLGVLRDKKLLDLLRGTQSLDESMSIIPTPGESPGHQLLKVSSKGQSAYCVGDLFHHWVEIEEPGWGPEWVDVKKNLTSKKELCETAVSERALIIPGHMTPGRIRNREGSSTNFQWVDSGD